ncbi:MAG: helix-turn-helix transcriptional regulator [Armatimonadetes bacterium]|nr:helix-turn-helix transcriptional regulator [Armatimonadota bacterium]
MQCVLASCSVGGEGGFAAQKAVYGRKLVTPPSSHAMAYLCLVEKGCFTETTPHGTTVRRAGGVHFHPPHELNDGAIGEEDLYVISVGIPATRYRDLKLSAEPFQEINSGILPLLIRQIEAHLDSSTKHAQSVIEAKVAGLFDEFSKTFRGQAPREPDWLEEAKRLLERGVSVSDVASRCEIHPASFARSFRRWTHCKPNEYAKLYMLTRARKMLHEDNCKLGEVALEAGFCDQSHFTREFRKHFGAPPSKYRLQRLR